MKELLAEIAMVEEEIARLESQIRALRNSLDKEKEFTRKSKYKLRQSETSMSSSDRPLPSSSIPIPPKKGITAPERLSFETKALHFISKAIKGDYNVSNFSNINDNTGSPKQLAEQKENHFFEVGFLEKVPKKSGLLKPPSPLRDLRHPTPRVSSVPM